MKRLELPEDFRERLLLLCEVAGRKRLLQHRKLAQDARRSARGITLVPLAASSPAPVLSGPALTAAAITPIAARAILPGPIFRPPSPRRRAGSILVCQVRSPSERVPLIGRQG